MEAMSRAKRKAIMCLARRYAGFFGGTCMACGFNMGHAYAHLPNWVLVFAWLVFFLCYWRYVVNESRLEKALRDDSPF